MSSITHPIKYMLLAVTTLLFVLISPVVNAQHADIWLVINDNRTAVSASNLETMSPVKRDLISNKLLFTGDFGDVGQGPNATDDPGFQAETNTFNSGAILNYRALGSLQFWNGTDWVNTLIDQERIHIEDALSSITTIDAVGILNSEGAIDQIAGDGSVHQHVDFSIDNSLGNGTVAPGVYMIELEFYLTNGVGGATVHDTSESILIAFNYQLSASEFESAINQLILPMSVSVPISGISLLMFAGLLVIIRRFTVSSNSRRITMS